jgi:hypothetical protein
LDGGTAAAVADDPPGQHSCTGKRVDVAEGMHRPVIQPEKCRLATVVEQYTDPTTRDEMVVVAGGRPHLNVVD